MGIAVFPTPSASVLKEYTQEFNSNGNWVAPDNTNSVEIFIVGGGGGGGGKNTTLNNAGGGGGGGGVIWKNISVTPGTTYAVTIGAGGAAGTVGATANSGSTGSSSSFGNILTVLGGGGGGASNANNTLNMPNAGATGGGHGGLQSNGSLYSGAGGGAGAPPIHLTAGTARLGVQWDPANIAKANIGSGGGFAPAWTATNVLNGDENRQVNAGGIGINGYGFGAGGAPSGISGTPIDTGFGAGIPGFSTFNSVVVNAVAGAANRGGGGGGSGGGASNATASAGGSGYCRIKYLA